MRVIPLALISVLFSSCGIIKLDHHYYAPTMSFELIEDNGWKLIAPSSKWVIDIRKTLLPKYFSSYTVDTSGSEVYNYFYATYKLDADNEIALFVNYPSSFFVRKTIRGENKYAEILYWNNEKQCIIGNKYKNIVMMIHKVDAEFDNTSIYFLKGKTKIQGLAYQGNRPHWYNGKKIEPTMYDLSKEYVYKTAFEKANMSNVQDFYFSFEPFTCQDYEDAVFVIDGFYYQGRQLPPLKVRLKYYDYGAVPEYIGPETLPVR